jgi:hypothetical protein
MAVHGTLGPVSELSRAVLDDRYRGDSGREGLNCSWSANDAEATI